MPLLGGWDADPAWASVYDWLVEHPRVGGALWRAGTGSPLSRLYDAAAPVGGLPAGAAVLDVPVGGGVALRALRPGQGLRYVACDLSPAMLRRAASRAAAYDVGGQVAPVAADVGSLPFADDSFDLVVSLTGLHCFPDPRRAVEEMVRVLRPDGEVSWSTLLEDSGVRHLPMRAVGRRAGLLGPGVTAAELRGRLADLGVEATLERSGPFAYVRGRLRGVSRRSAGRRPGWRRP